MVRLSLLCTRPRQAAAGDAATVTDILWAHATEADRLDHVRGRAHRDRVDLMLFLRQESDDDSAAHDPQARAAALLDRSYRASPLLRTGYQAPYPPHV